MEPTVLSLATNVTNSLDLLSIIGKNSVTLGDTVYETMGPHFDRQFMRFTNQTVVDKVPEEMMHLVHKYWYQFPPMDPLWHKVLGILMLVIGVVGISGNGLVVYIFLMTASLRSPSNLLVVNLAFSDLLMNFAMSPMVVVNCYYETWALGPFACDAHALVGSLCGGASIWTMVAIARDRYNVIVNGMSGKPLTIQIALLKILLIWSFAGVWATLPLFGWNQYVPEGNMTSCGTDYFTQTWLSKSYIFVYSGFVYFLPLFLIIYSYYFIVSTVAAHEKGMRDQAKKMGVASLRSGEQDSVSAEAKLAKVAITTISLWFCAWTPYLVINYVGILSLVKISPLSTIWGSVLAKTNACYNPVVYALSHPKFRAALEEKAPCCVCGTVDKPSAPAKSGGGDTQSTTEKA